MDADAFDSSDGLSDGDEHDWDRSQFDRSKNIGKRQIETLLARQVEDRSQSKRNARKLTYAAGAPNTQAGMLQVERTWDTFYEGLGMNKETCPTGEQIFRYVDTMTRHVRPGVAGKPVPSLSVIQGIWYRLIRLLTFRHREIRESYNSTDVARIQVHLDQLVKRNLLIKGKWFRKHWLGFVIVERMARNWLECGLADGCLSWDRMLLKLLGIVLQSALGARSGDVARSKLYTGMQCLCYEDVELTLPPCVESDTLSVDQLSGKFTLRFRKHKKDVLNDDDIIFIDPIKEKAQQCVCAIKILLIVALRFGQVHGTTIQDVLTHTAKRVDRKVQWTHAKRPVICQMPRGSTVLTLDKPAPQNQLCTSVKQLALALGIIDRVTSQAVRRGAMRDAAYLGRVVTGVSTELSAVTGSHSKRSENGGLTRMYVGALQHDTYNMRASHQFKDKLAPKIAASPLVIRRNTTKDIDDYMKEHRMDKSVSFLRQTAGLRLQEMQIDAWREAEKNREVTDSTSHDQTLERLTSKSEIGRGKTLSTLSKKANTTTAPNIGAPLREASSSERNATQGQLQKAAKSSGQPEKYFAADGELPIDPQLLALDGTVDDNEAEVDETHFDMLESLVFDGRCEDDDSTTGSTSVAGDDIWDSDTVDNALIELHLGQAPAPDNLSPLELESNDFVNWFAAINVFKLSASFKQNDPDEAAKRVPTGNSRDAPTPFSYCCGIGECDYKTWSHRALEVHQISCKGTSRNVQKYFSCDLHDPPLQFLTADSLRAHITVYHSWKPRPCLRCPEAPDVLYYSAHEWKVHQAKIHDVFKDGIHCPLRDQGECNNSEKLYENFSSIRSHLSSVHKQTAEQIRVFFPAKKAVRPAKGVYSCPIEDCDFKDGKTNRELRNHLKRKHEKTEEEAIELVPLSSLEQTNKKRKLEEKEPKPAKELWKCAVEDCKRTFPANRDRRQHLVKKHSWTEEEAKAFVPLSKAEIGRDNARQKKEAMQ